MFSVVFDSRVFLGFSVNKFFFVSRRFTGRFFSALGLLCMLMIAGGVVHNHFGIAKVRAGLDRNRGDILSTAEPVVLYPRSVSYDPETRVVSFVYHVRVVSSDFDPSVFPEFETFEVKKVASE